ncbi:DM13 domain-containing protein [soil metagenome]
MKSIFYLLFAFVLFAASCSKGDETSTTPATDVIPGSTPGPGVDPITGTAKYSGVFASAPGESVTGNALIFFENNAYSVALENVKIGSGPDLHLYLAKEKQATNFIDLGKLKSFSGNQVYPLTTSPDFSQYKYVLIYCQQFNVLFGSAELIKK